MKEVPSSPNFKNRSVIALIAFLVILLAISLYLAIQNYQLKEQICGLEEQIKFPSQTIVAQPTPLASLGASPTPDPTAGWQVYRNEELGFEFKYPQAALPKDEINNSFNDQFAVTFSGNPNFSLDVQILNQNQTENYLGIEKIDELLVNERTWQVLYAKEWADMEIKAIDLTVYQFLKNDRRFAFSFSKSKPKDPTHLQILATFRFLE